MLDDECVTNLHGSEGYAGSVLCRPLDIIAVSDMSDTMLLDHLFGNNDDLTVLGVSVYEQQVMLELNQHVRKQFSVIRIRDSSEHLSISEGTFNSLEADMLLVLLFQHLTDMLCVRIRSFDQILTPHEQFTTDDSHHHVERLLIVHSTLDVLLGHHIQVQEHFQQRDITKLTEHDVVDRQLHDRLRLVRDLEHLIGKFLCSFKTNFHNAFLLFVK